MFSAGDERIQADLALELATEVAYAAHRHWQRPHAGRVTQAHRRLVTDTREAVAADPSLPSARLAMLCSVSSHHLSRPLPRRRARYTTTSDLTRICAPLDRLRDGEDNLARLAAELGFADHAHLTRTLHEHTRRTPSQLRVEVTQANS
jgi:transcriptional regulator GlxA family with amidase domain